MSDDAPPPQAKPAPNPLLALYEKQPVLAALAALALLEIVPVLALVASSREGWDAWATPAAALAVAALLPAAGLAFRKSWGFTAAGYVCWFGIILVVLRAMTVGLSLPALLPAAAYGLVLAGLSSLARRPGPDAKASAPAADPPLAAWAKENVEAIFVAFIMALVIRCFGIEVFKIPSSSMEPTLLGDVERRNGALFHGGRCDFEPYHQVSRTSSGDRIMVTKFYYAFADIQRYDVVVFKFPLNQSRNFIKRVVGLPDEELLLYHGNVYAKRKGDEQFRVMRRPPGTQEALWIDPADDRTFLDAWEDFVAYWDVEGPKPSVLGGQLRYDAPEGGGATSIRYKGNLRDPRGQEVSDLRIEFELTPTNEKGEVFAEISGLYGRFELRLSAAADAVLGWKGKEVSRTATAPARLELGRRARVELGVYDGLAYAKIGGASAKLAFIETRSDVKPVEGEPSIRFGASGAAFELRGLRVGRDVHYRPARDGVYRGDKLVRRFEEDLPYRVEPGHYVVMGDNVTSSHDSRGWVKKGYKLESGEIVEYETQQEFEKGVDVESIQARYKLKVTPSELVADKYGRIWALYAKGTMPGDLPPNVPAGVIEAELPSEDFYQIGENFIVGKALWVWWPPGRWFNLIR